MSKDYLTTSIGRLRIAGVLEGLSLILLVCVGVPLKYGLNEPAVVRILGPIHGFLFVLFIVFLIDSVIQYKLKWRTTALLILSCFIPFGTFYLDRKILSKVHDQERSRE